MTGLAPLRAAGVGILLVALAGPGWPSVRPDEAPLRDPAAVPTSLLADPGACKPGPVEGVLNEWLVSSMRVEFESETAAIVFDELLAMVAVLRDVAQDFCV